ncbi:MAG: hypothetical protein RIE56_01245 [Amphiplicatus sp.]
MAFRRVVLALLQVAAACLSASAAAQDPGRDAFDAGDFAGARAAGRSAGTGSGFSLACQAGLVIGSYIETDEEAVASLHGAIDDCARAIAMDRSRIDAFVNYAIAVAFEAKRLNNRKLAGASRRLMEEALARFPQSAFAHAALAGWHASVSDQGFFAQTALGASRDRAAAEFGEALRLEPTNFAVIYQHLRFLAAGGKKDRAEAVATAAYLAHESPPKSRFEQMLRERAAVIAAAIESGGASSADEALKTTEPFYRIEQAHAGAPFDFPYLAQFPDAPATQ